MELDNIKLQTTWNDAAGSINNNFLKLKQAIGAIEGGGGEAYTLPLASYYERGGIKIGFSETWVAGSYYDMALKLSSNEAAFIHLTSDILQEVLGYTPLASDAFTKANIKSVLGIADWALEANKPSYAWNEIDERPTRLSDFTNDLDLDLGLGELAYKDSLAVSDIPFLPWSKITDGKPTTLAGYGIADAVIYQNGIDTATDFKKYGYGHASGGWRGSGPAMIFGVQNYNIALQSSNEATDYVSLYVRNKFNGVEYGWDRIVTEGLLSQGAISFDTSAYKCRGDIVLHRNTDDGITFLNFGPANSDKAALQAFGQNITFYAGVASAYDSYLILDGNLGNVQVRKPLHLSQTLYTKTIFAEGRVILRTTSGDRFFRSRSIDADGAVIAEIGFGVGSNGVNRGIYDYTNGRWLLVNYGDGRVVYQGDKFLVKTTEVYEPKDGGTTPIRLGGGVRIDDSIYLPNSGQVKIANSAGDKDLIIFQLNNNNDFLVGQKTAAEGYDTYLYGNALHFKINKGATELLTLTEGGNVGIGKITPAYKLDINGQLNSANFVVGAALTSDPTESFQTTVFGSNDSLYYKMRLMRPGNANFGRVATPYAATLCLKSGDTHGYISIPYQESNKNKCYIGGGNANKINWKGALFHDNMDLLPVTDDSFAIGSASLRYKSLAVSTSVKIGDATLSWDGEAGMLKFDTGIYSTGAVTAGGKGSSNKYRLDSWAEWTVDSDGNVTDAKLLESSLSAKLGVELNKRLVALEDSSSIGTVSINVRSIASKSTMTNDEGITAGLTYDVVQNLLDGRYTKVLYKDDNGQEVWDYTASYSTDGTSLYFRQGDGADVHNSISMKRTSAVGVWTIIFTEI